MIRSPAKLFILQVPLQTEKVTKLINTSSPKKPKPLRIRSSSATKFRFSSINIKRSVWLSLFKVLLCSIVLISIFTFSALAAIDLPDDWAAQILEKPYKFSLMQEDDYIQGSTSLTVGGSNLNSWSISDFELIDNPYPTELNQNNKVWRTQLDLRQYNDFTLYLNNLVISAEWALPLDTSYGNATYLSFGVLCCLESRYNINGFIDEMSFNVGDTAVDATRIVTNGNTMFLLFQVPKAMISQTMEQQKLRMNVTLGDWDGYDPFSDVPYFYMQFGEITQTVEMTANQAYLDNIFGLLQGTSGNNQAGSDFNSSMQAGSQNASNLVNQMNQMQKPSVDQLNNAVNINAYLNNTGTNLLTSTLSLFSNFGLFSSMILITVSLSLISFVFFGKKG